MARFMGGPYDGQEFPVTDTLVEVRLPDPDQFDSYNPVLTANIEWPHVYRRSRHGPVFRYTSETNGDLPD